VRLKLAFPPIYFIGGDFSNKIREVGALRMTKWLGAELSTGNITAKSPSEKEGLQPCGLRSG
jgi:hypothetical protein